MQPPFRLVVRLKRSATWAHRLAPGVVSFSLVSLICTVIPMFICLRGGSIVVLLRAARTRIIIEKTN